MYLISISSINNAYKDYCLTTGLFAATNSLKLKVLNLKLDKTFRKMCHWTRSRSYFSIISFQFRWWKVENATKNTCMERERQRGINGLSAQKVSCYKAAFSGLLSAWIEKNLGGSSFPFNTLFSLPSSWIALILHPFCWAPCPSLILCVSFWSEGAALTSAPMFSPQSSFCSSSSPQTSVCVTGERTVTFPWCSTPPLSLSFSLPLSFFFFP